MQYKTGQINTLRPMAFNVKIPEIRVSLKYKGREKDEKPFVITNVFEAYAVFKKVFDADTFAWREEAIMLCLNNANEVIGFFKISVGGQTSTVLDTRIIFSVALSCGATVIMIAHNHPSGKLTPSGDDLHAYNRIKEAGNLIQIKLLDFFILSTKGIYSFNDEVSFPLYVLDPIIKKYNL